MLNIYDNKLITKPSDKFLLFMAIITFVMAILVNQLMHYYWALSGYPESVMVMELNFSADLLKSHYAIMLSEGDINGLRAFQYTDYAFMLIYGIWGYSFALLLARKFEKDSIFYKTGCLVALSLIPVVILDAIENLFSLITLQDPLNFPDWLALAESWVSLIKWLIGLIDVLWLFIVIIILIFRLITKNRK